MKMLSQSSMVAGMLLGSMVLATSVFAGTETSSDQSAASASQVSAKRDVVVDAVQGVDDFVIATEVASACGWTTKDHVRLEQARDALVHTGLHLLVTQGDMSEREFNEAYATVTSTAYMVSHAQQALDQTKHGVCDNMKVKAQWNMTSASLQIQLTDQPKLSLADRLNPLNKVKALIKAAQDQQAQTASN